MSERAFALDLFEALRQRDEGMALAATAQERLAAGWAERAYVALTAIARQQPTVHVDDIIATFTEEPAHFNAWGQVWKRALREEVIELSGVYRRSAHRRKHAHNYPVYDSLICTRRA